MWGLVLLAALLPGARAALGFNHSEEKLIDFLEAKKWVRNYDDLRLSVGRFWEPSRASLNQHHNYAQLTVFLKDLAARFPHLASLDSIGRSVEGRELWVLTLGTRPRFHLPGRPEVKYVANMHGNEVLGRELLLRLASVLLENQGRNRFMSALLERTRIHLLPSMNPDGYERAVEGDEQGTRGRENAQGVDLNRNFPAQDDYRAHYQGEPRALQPETEAVMRWTRGLPFVLSASLHSGTALVNYPFDDGHGPRARTGDDELFMTLAYSYARAHKRMHKKGPRCQQADMNDPADPHLGIVNGASWYEVTGGMQDWNYVFGRCFEVTVEMNCAKFPRAAQLAAFWDEHKFALLHFLDLARQGLHGFVLDAQTGRGLPDVRISLGRGPLETRSFRHGDFWRPLLPGQYNVTFLHPLYFPQVHALTVPEHGRRLSFNVSLRAFSFDAGRRAPGSSSSGASSASGAAPGARRASGLGALLACCATGLLLARVR